MAKTELTEAETLMRHRLRIARLRHGWATAQDASLYVQSVKAAKARTYKAYDEGQRPLTFEAAEHLARAFGVEARWLREGAGETREQLLREFHELMEVATDTPRRMVSAGQQEETPESQSLNQLTSKLVKLDISPSQLVPTGRIPFLLADGTASFLAGKRDAAMAGPTLPVSEEFAGPDFFAYEIGSSDTSMTGGDADSFPPRTVLIINSNPLAWQEQTPPFYVLARPKGMKGWLFRRLEAALPLSVASEYTLRALDPSIDPIRVSDPAKWEIAGRLVADQRRY